MRGNVYVRQRNVMEGGRVTKSLTVGTQQQQNTTTNSCKVNHGKFYLQTLTYESFKNS